MNILKLKLITVFLGTFLAANISNAAVYTINLELDLSSGDLSETNNTHVFMLNHYFDTPFELLLGDELIINTSFIDNKRLGFSYDGHEQQKFLIFLNDESASSRNVQYQHSFEFVDVQGDLLTNHYSNTTRSIGSGTWGITTGPASVTTHLTDTSFSIGGTRTTYLITDLVDQDFYRFNWLNMQAAFMDIEIIEQPISEPLLISILGFGLFGLVIRRRR